MGLRESKPICLTYEDACKRVRSSERKRICLILNEIAKNDRIASMDISNVTNKTKCSGQGEGRSSIAALPPVASLTSISFQSFHSQVIGSYVPKALAARIFCLVALSSSYNNGGHDKLHCNRTKSESVNMEEIVNTLEDEKIGVEIESVFALIVLLSYFGSDEERTRFFFNLMSNDFSHLRRECMESKLSQWEAPIESHILDNLFEKNAKVGFETFRNWIQSTNISQYNELLSDQTNQISETNMTLLKNPALRWLYLIDPRKSAVIHFFPQNGVPQYSKQLSKYIETLSQMTTLNKIHLQEVHSCFVELTSSTLNGYLSRKQFYSLLAAPFSYFTMNDSYLFWNSLFTAFDINGDGNIDFYELVMSLSQTCRRPTLETQKFCFKIFDLNNDGILDKDEIHFMIDCLYAACITTYKCLDENVIKETIWQEIVTWCAKFKHNTVSSINLELEEYMLLTLNTKPAYYRMTCRIADSPTNNFARLLSDALHITFGLRPASKREEGQIVYSWLSRMNVEHLVEGEETISTTASYYEPDLFSCTWHLIDVVWWREWAAYVELDISNGIKASEVCEQQEIQPISYQSEKDSVSSRRTKKRKSNTTSKKKSTPESTYSNTLKLSSDNATSGISVKGIEQICTSSPINSTLAMDVNSPVVTTKYSALCDDFHIISDSTFIEEFQNGHSTSNVSGKHTSRSDWRLTSCGSMSSTANGISTYSSSPGSYSAETSGILSDVYTSNHMCESRPTMANEHSSSSPQRSAGNSSFNRDRSTSSFCSVKSGPVTSTSSGQSSSHKKIERHVSNSSAKKPGPINNDRLVYKDGNHNHGKQHDKMNDHEAHFSLGGGGSSHHSMSGSPKENFKKSGGTKMFAEKVSLRSNQLKAFQDFQIVPNQVFKALSWWYGDVDFDLSRSVIHLKNSTVSKQLELYPPMVNVFQIISKQNNEKSKLRACTLVHSATMSRQTSLRQVYESINEVLGLEGEDTFRLWYILKMSERASSDIVTVKQDNMYRLEDDSQKDLEGLITELENSGYHRLRSIGNDSEESGPKLEIDDIPSSQYINNTNDPYSDTDYCYGAWSELITCQGYECRDLVFEKNVSHMTDALCFNKLHPKSPRDGSSKYERTYDMNEGERWCKTNVINLYLELQSIDNTWPEEIATLMHDTTASIITSTDFSIGDLECLNSGEYHRSRLGSVGSLSSITKRRRNSSATMTTSSLSSFNHNSISNMNISDQPLGVVGLQNLGNTCYLNSAIQCLAHTPILSNYFREGFHNLEINVTNVLGTQGVLTMVVADLIGHMYSCATPVTTSIVPFKLRWTLSRCCPLYDSCFSELQQQDAQEIINYLLDAFHEDLNRVNTDGNFEKSPNDKTENRNDNSAECDTAVAEENSFIRVAKKSWELHTQKNRSIVVDLFHGQIQSRVTCTQCGHHSYKYEPFTHLSLPLPMDSDMVCIHVTVVRQNPMEYTVNYGLIINTQDDLISRNKQKMSLTKLVIIKVKKVMFGETCTPEAGGTYILADLFAEKLEILDTMTSMEELKKVKRLYAFQVSKDDEEDNNTVDYGGNRCFDSVKEDVTSETVIVLLHRAVIVNQTSCHKYSKVFGLPNILLRSDFSSVQDLAKHIMVKFRRIILRKMGNESQNFMNDTENLTSFPFRLRIVTESGLWCALCDWCYVCTGCKLDSTNFLKARYIAIEWKATFLKIQYCIDIEQDLNLRRYAVVEHSSIEECKIEMERKTMSLDQCLEAFCRDEYLGDEETYFCEKCNDNRRIIKRLKLWRLPPILIIQLKRFQIVSKSSGELADKKGHQLTLYNNNSHGEVSNKHLDISRSQFAMSMNMSSSAFSAAGKAILSASQNFRSKVSCSPSPALNYDEMDNIPESLFGGHCWVKNKRIINFPIQETMDLRPYLAEQPRGASSRNKTKMTSPDDKDDVNHEHHHDFHEHKLIGGMKVHDMKYQLYASISHSGTLSRGHYTSYVKSMNGRWYHQNDSTCKELNSENDVDKSNAYILFYRRKGLYTEAYINSVAQAYPSTLMNKTSLVSNGSSEKSVNLVEQKLHGTFKRMYVTPVVTRMSNNAPLDVHSGGGGSDGTTSSALLNRNQNEPSCNSHREDGNMNDGVKNLKFEVGDEVCNESVLVDDETDLLSKFNQDNQVEDVEVRPPAAMNTNHRLLSTTPSTNTMSGMLTNLRLTLRGNNSV